MRHWLLIGSIYACLMCFVCQVLPLWGNNDVAIHWVDIDTESDTEGDTVPSDSDTSSPKEPVSEDDLPQNENLKNKSTEDKYIYPYHLVAALLSGELYHCKVSALWFSQNYASCNHSNLPALPPEA